MPIPRQELIELVKYLPMMRGEINEDLQDFMDKSPQMLPNRAMITGADLHTVISDIYRTSRDKTLILDCMRLWFGNLQNYLTANDKADLQKLFYEAIARNLNDVVNLFIEVKFCLEKNGPELYGKQYNALLYSILFDNSYAFNLLLPIYKQAGRLNEQNEFCESAIYIAVRFNRQSMIDKLLAEKDILLVGGIHTTLFDLVRLNSTLWDKLVKSLNKKNIYYDWDQPLELPVASLHSGQQQLLMDLLEEELKLNAFFKDNTELRELILKFVNDKDPLPFKRMNRLSIAIECVSYLLFPEWISQHNSNLCGPAVVMQQLAINDPLQFANMVFDMAELPLTGKPGHLPHHVKHISPDIIKSCWNLSAFWVETMRHNYNRRAGFAFDSRFSAYTALTTPHLLGKMLEDLGFSVLKDNFQVRFSNNNRVAEFFEKARPLVAKVGRLIEPYKIYGKSHLEQSDAETRFQSFLNWFGQDDVAPILINKKLLYLIMKQKEEPDTQKFLEFSHYVNIRDFKYDAMQDTVSFKCMTFGKMFDVDGLDKKTFAENFLGGIKLKPQQTLVRSSSI